MKQVFSVLMLLLLCLGSATFTIKVQPARADGTHTPLSVDVTPYYTLMSGGQSQLFNSTVTGGYPPYQYQWVLLQDGARWYKIPGATDPTYNFTAPFSTGPPMVVGVWVTDSAIKTVDQYVSVWEPPMDKPVFLSVEPVQVAPLADVNASTYGLETLPSLSPVGENFTVEIHLRNATATNVAAGVAGVDVRFYFGNILDYCKPIGFTDELGQTGGVFVGPLIYGLTGGFYDGDLNPIDDPPFANATLYAVAASSTGSGWNGNDGLVAKITFQITGQPLQNMSQPDFYAPLQIVFGELEDKNVSDIALSVAQGTLHIDRTPSLVGDLNGNGKVGLDDIVLLADAYGSKVGDPNWNPIANIAPPYGKIGLTDLVTLASHYGQHYP